MHSSSWAGDIGPISDLGLVVAAHCKSPLSRYKGVWIVSKLGSPETAVGKSQSGTNLPPSLLSVKAGSSPLLSGHPQEVLLNRCWRCGAEER